jgi:hypothetical protein
MADKTKTVIMAVPDPSKAYVVLEFPIESTDIEIENLLNMVVRNYWDPKMWKKHLESTNVAKVVSDEVNIFAADARGIVRKLKLQVK